MCSGRNCIHHLNLQTKELSTDHYSDCITSLAFHSDRSRLYAIAREGLASVPWPAPPSSCEKPLKLEYVCKNPVPDELCDARMFNDSAVDSFGRIYMGSKTLRGQPFNEDQLPGRFYKVERRKGTWLSEEVAAIGHMTVPNGADFSPDFKTM